MVEAHRCVCKVHHGGYSAFRVFTLMGVQSLAPILSAGDCLVKVRGQIPISEYYIAGALGIDGMVTGVVG